MTWGASDFALVITTSATAFTAIASFWGPLFSDWKNQRTRKKEAKYQRLYDAVIACISRIDRATSLYKQKHLAAVYKGGDNLKLSAEQEELIGKFESALTMVKIHASEIGVDCSEFSVQVLTARRCAITYAHKAITNPPTTELDQIISEESHATSKATSAAATLLAEAREKIGLE